ADAQVILSQGEILLGGFPIPFDRLHLILCDACTLVVADAQIALSLGEILLGGPAIPLYRLHLILRHAFALVVATTQFHLVLCFTRFCLHLPFLNRFLIGLGLLRGQLNDSDTRRQQEREYQSTRFHIEKRNWFPAHLVFSVKHNHNGSVSA